MIERDERIDSAAPVVTASGEGPVTRSPDVLRRRGTGDDGAAITELVAILPIGLVIILVAFEALLAGTTVERVENAARTGARLASQEQNAGMCRGKALDAMPNWIDQTQADGGWRGDGLYCHVRAEVPVLFPGAHLDFTIDRTVRMPVG